MKQYGPYYITDNYKVEADNLCFILYEKRIGGKGKSKGNIFWDVIGYYGQIHHLLDKILNLGIAYNLGDLGKAIKRMDEVEKELHKLAMIKQERESTWHNQKEKSFH